MKLTITTHWPEITARDGSKVQPKDQIVVYPESGYQSVAEMQKELMRRFKHRNPQKIQNGVRYDESYGRTQFVTLHA